MEAEQRRLIVNRLCRGLGAVDADMGEKAWVILGGRIHITHNDGYLFAHGRTM